MANSDVLRLRIARRRSQRGAAVFVVLVTVVAISALGLIAVSTTSQLNRAVGNSRHMLQTHFINDMAVTAAMSDMSNLAGREYLGMMLAKTSKDCEAQAKMASQECYVVVYDALKSRFKKQKAPVDIIEQPVGALPGTLGPTALTADVKVELNDMVRAERYVPGFEISQDRTWSYYAVTMTASGFVRPTSPGGKVDKVSAGAMGRESARVHLVMGPFEKGSILPPVSN